MLKYENAKQGGHLMRYNYPASSIHDYLLYKRVENPPKTKKTKPHFYHIYRGFWGKNGKFISGSDCHLCGNTLLQDAINQYTPDQCPVEIVEGEDETTYYIITNT